VENAQNQESSGMAGKPWPKTAADYERENQLWVMERDLRNELGVPPKWALNKDKIEFHRRQLALLEQANKAPRCEHVFTDGRSCGAPRVRKGKLCYAHTLMEEKRPQRLNLPPLEDANAVMLWLMDVSRGLLDGSISERTAGLMFYGLQLAMINARHTTFKETDHAEMVRKAPKEFTVKDTKEEKRQDQKPAILTAETRRDGEPPDFTAESAERAEEKEEDRKYQESVRLAAETREHRGKTGAESTAASEIVEGTPGLTGAKSIFSGVEQGVG
jgi:hypothetical protein